MRTAPIGVYFAENADARRKASIADSMITHADPRCVLACAAFNSAIAATVSSFTAEPADLLAAARAEVGEAVEELLRREKYDIPKVVRAAAELRRDLDAAADEDPQLYGPELHLHEQMGFVRVAFRGAFWELLHAPTFEAGVIDCANRFSDSDTVGAITGALLGAYHGESAIPSRWKTAVLNALQDGPPGPLRDTFHPRRLLELVP